MTVPLKPGWESRVSAIKPRIYPLGNEARRVVDDTFEEMHKQGRLQYTTDPTPFSFPVFVVFRLTTRAGEKAGQSLTSVSLTSWYFPTLTRCPCSRRSSPTCKVAPTWPSSTRPRSSTNGASTLIIVSCSLS